MPAKPAPTALDDLIRLSTERTRIEDEIHRQALTVISSGGSWATVAAALGVSKQSAWERYRIIPAKYQ